MDRDLLKRRTYILANTSYVKARYGQGTRVHYHGKHIGYLKENSGASGGHCCFDTGHVYLNLYSQTIEKATLKLVEWHQNQQSR
jgi:hypothetical protein